MMVHIRWTATDKVIQGLADRRLEVWEKGDCCGGGLLLKNRPLCLAVYGGRDLAGIVDDTDSKTGIATLYGVTLAHTMTNVYRI